MILAVLQARVSSTRLPGKVLLPLLGKPMLLRQIERIAKARKIDKLVVATSTDPSDDPLAALCEENGIACARGDLNDVLDRCFQAARAFQPDIVVRLTGDCPLADPAVIDATIDAFCRGDFDYLSSALPPTFPDGLDVEVFRFAAMEKAALEAKLPSEREHVTPYLYKNPHLFRIGSHQNDKDLSALRWTVDEPEDYAFVTRLYEALYPQNPAFAMRDILDLLEKNPGLSGLNKGFTRNEGLHKSLELDEKVKNNV